MSHRTLSWLTPLLALCLLGGCSEKIVTRDARSDVNPPSVASKVPLPAALPEQTGTETTNPPPKATDPGCRFIVSPQGNDSWSGTLAYPSEDGKDGPFATPHRARDAIRELRKAAEGKLEAAIDVCFREGSYFLETPLALGPEDSGAVQDGKELYITYRAFAAEKLILSGGRRISGAKVDADGSWVVDIPEAKARKWVFEQLYVNGRRAVRARYPDTGFLKVEGRADGSTPTFAGGASDAAFRVSAESWNFLKKIPLAARKDAALTLFHSWSVSRHSLASVSDGEPIVTLQTPSLFGIQYWGKEQRYYVENFAAAADTAGEWFLDADAGRLRYLPLPGEKPDTAEIIAPRHGNLVEMRGVWTKGIGVWAGREAVGYIRWKGISFQHSHSGAAAGRFVNDVQADPNLQGALAAEAATHVVIEDCEFAHTGGYGIDFVGSGAPQPDGKLLPDGALGGNTEITIAHNYLHDLGGGGIKANYTAGLRVRNNVITGGGRIHWGSVGILAMLVWESEITHNDISDFFYTGISEGWSWGYGYSPSSNISITHNHISRIGQGMLSDLGGIYTLGVHGDKGLLIANNHIHDVSSFDAYGWASGGIYSDEGTSNAVIEKNLIHDVKDYAYWLHYGRNIELRNNVFAFTGRGALGLCKADALPAGGRSLLVTRNILHSAQGSVPTEWSYNAYCVMNDAQFLVDENLVHESSGYALAPLVSDLQARGHFQKSKLADPLFRDPSARDFRLAADSPAFSLGFQEFDFASAGVEGDEAWRALGRSIHAGSQGVWRARTGTTLVHTATSFPGDEHQVARTGNTLTGFSVAPELIGQNLPYARMAAFPFSQSGESHMSRRPKMLLRVVGEVLGSTEASCLVVNPIFWKRGVYAGEGGESFEVRGKFSVEHLTTIPFETDTVTPGLRIPPSCAFRHGESLRIDRIEVLAPERD